jgi:hypothetical protein
MTNSIVTAAKASLTGLQSLGRGLRRGIVAICAVVAMIVIYGLGSIGTYGLTLAGVTGLQVATATPAQAWRRRGRRRRGIWWGGRRRRRRRRRGPYLYFGW